MVKEQHPKAVAAATSEILPAWLQAVDAILAANVVDDLQRGEDGWENLAVRNEAFRVLDTVLASFPKALQASLPIFVQHAIAHLGALAPIFRAIYLIEDGESAPQVSEDGSDVSADLPRLAGHAIDFVQHASKKTWAKTVFIDPVSGEATSVLTQSIVALLHFGQITSEDVSAV